MSDLDPTPVHDLEYWLSIWSPARDRWIDEQLPIDHPNPTGEAGHVPAAAGGPAYLPAAQIVAPGDARGCAATG
jgi:hypothetical protein